jgi:hypothetical protein
MVHLIYIIITSLNLLIFTVLRPTGISTHKASDKQVLTNLLYISSLFLITSINAWATYVVNIRLVFWFLVFRSSLQKSFQSLEKMFAHSITDVHPFSIHIQKTYLSSRSIDGMTLLIIFQIAQMHVFLIITLHLDPSISE